MARLPAAFAALVLAGCASDPTTQASATPAEYAPAPMPMCLRGNAYTVRKPTFAENTAELMLGLLGRGPSADTRRAAENEARRKSCGCSVC